MTDKNAPVTPRGVDERPRWIAVEQKIRAWGTLFLFIFTFAGTLGVFSKGYLSDGVAQDRAGNLSVEYERFGRIISDMDMKITWQGSGASVSTLTLGGEFMDRYEVLTLNPRPQRAYSRDNQLILEYPATDAQHPHTLWIGLQPRQAGVGRATFRVDRNDPVTLFQLIYP